VRQTVEADPRGFAQALLPVMAPTMRKAIADAFKTLREFLHTQQGQLDQFSQHSEQQRGKLEQRVAVLEAALERVRRLEAQLNDSEYRIRELAAVLPAVIQQANELEQAATEAKAEMSLDLSHGELPSALQGPVTHCIRQSISQDASSFADALFPVMGPAIRKSIRESLRGMIESLNQTLEQSLSLRGMKWRLEALRTGRSFGEIAMQNTVVYRVDQAFLIHRDSGLLILHQAQDDVQEVSDSEAVSAMLTAIRDFTRDSFSASKTEELESVDIGNYTVWMERGPYAILACVIRGIAPYRYREQMRGLLEAMHARYGRLIEKFAGDSVPLEVCRPLLAKALQSELKEGEKKQRRLLSPPLIVILLLLSGILIWRGYQSYITMQEHDAYRRQAQNFLETLRRTPGLVLLESQIAPDAAAGSAKLKLRGLRDPLAEEPDRLAALAGLAAQDLDMAWHPYQDLSAGFAQRRLQQQVQNWLRPPASVQAEWRDQMLYLKGHADRAWIERIRDGAPLLQGLAGLDLSELRDSAEYLAQTEPQFSAFLNALKQTPGLVVIRSGVENGQRVIAGLRDPLAEDPAQIAARMQAPEVTMDWKPYQDITPLFVERRVRLALQPPDTVAVSLESGVLYLRGHATKEWIAPALQRAQPAAGILRIDAGGLQETDVMLLQQARQALNPPPSVTLQVSQAVLFVTGRADAATFYGLQEKLPQLQGFQNIDSAQLKNADAERFERLAKQIEETAIYFQDDTTLAENQEAALEKIAKSLQAMQASGERLRPPQAAKLKIISHTDGVGSREFNQQLSRQRTEAVYTALIARQIPAEWLEPGMPEQVRHSERQADYQQRKATFQVLR
jgi:outer membrane protein OmpA-like peptidoglycan-associated protein